MGLSITMAVATEAAAYTPPEGDLGSDPVPFGVKHMDIAFPRGVKPTSPQINVIQGGGGSRKTTLMLAFIESQCTSGLLPKDHLIVVDSLETGMTIERYALILRAIVATKIMIYEEHTGKQSTTIRELFDRRLPDMSPEDIIDQVSSGSGSWCRTDCCLFPDFIESWYARQDGFAMSPRQDDAWGRAGDAVSDFPIVLNGISEHMDIEERIRRVTHTTTIEDSFERWKKLSDENGSVQLVIDYMQEYFIPGVMEHYQKQLRVVPYVAEWVKYSGNTAWVLSQEGVGHQKDAMAGRQVLGSSGGDILKNSAQLNVRVEYRKEKNPFWILLFPPVKARRGSFSKCGLMLEPNSGAIFGESKSFSQIKAMVT